MENVKIDQIEIERTKINQIDCRLIELLDKRFEVVKTIAHIKKQKQMQIFQAGREQEVLERITSLSKNSHCSIEIFKSIMGQSKKLQEELICK